MVGGGGILASGEMVVVDGSTSLWFDGSGDWWLGKREITPF